MNTSATPAQPATTGPSSLPPRGSFWRRKPFLITVVAGVVALGGLWFVLKDSATLSFAFLLDGKPLPVGLTPKVELDGRPFTSGVTVGMGKHRLTADLPNVEPFAQDVSVFVGRKDLGSIPLVSSKGTLVVAATPAPAGVTVRRGLESVAVGMAPLTAEKLVPGIYEVEIKRGDYTETHSVKVAGRERTEKKIELNLGSVELAAQPADAEYQLSGNGQMRQGKLPALLEDVPVGDYRLTARRKGWEQHADVTVARGTTATWRIEFPYGSINVTSEPSGLAVSMNGTEAGKTPLLLKEIKPAQYALAVTDGSNDLTTNIIVGPRDAAKHTFVFRYGAVQLSSTPAAATVFRKGIEIGKTPLTLERILADETEIELRLQGYESVRHSIRVVEGETAKLATKLYSETYVQAMKQAREALGASQFSESQKLIATALESEPDDSAALKLRSEVSEAAAKTAEALRIEQANAKTRALASLPSLDFSKAIADCTETKQVQYSVEVPDGYYQEYIDDKDRQKYNEERDERKKQRYVKRRFVQTGKHAEMRTKVESTFSWTKFAEGYRNRTFSFNCPDKWSVVKIEKGGSITLKAGGMGSDEIKVSASRSNPGAFNSLQKGQKVTIKGVLTKYEAGGLFTPRSLYLEDADIVDTTTSSEQSKASLAKPLPLTEATPAVSVNATSEIPRPTPAAALESGSAEAKDASNMESGARASLEEIKAWLESELPRLGSFSVVSTRNDGTSSPITYVYAIERAALSNGSLFISRTIISRDPSRPSRTTTVTEIVPLKALDARKIEVRERSAAPGYSHSRPSYFVSLIPTPGRTASITSFLKSEDQALRETKPTSILVLVGSREAANRVADVLRRATVLCGARDPNVDAGSFDAVPMLASSQTNPGASINSHPTTEQASVSAVREIPDRSMFNGMRAFDISMLDQPPIQRFQARPHYPLEMRRAGTRGEVVVDFLVDTDGNVQNAYAMKSSHREFEAPAVQAVSKWKFKPGRKGGRDVVTHMQIPIVFSLNQE